MKTVNVLGKVILKLLNSFRKKTNASENLVENNVVVQNVIELQNKMKNSWLYPVDQFGKMKIGIENESQNYEREMPTTKSDYEIINS
ncbi:hypothetical protein FEDK69T_13580 [Flavobacterium enshiense DK69]|uniref:Uncharacterized protein n=1 Tax=Flavobacterium enshiense DK69 TaxID=1107311 RepID=V6SFM9_9FLAO|nr:hypothetical protein [Flavobacterium enshiense]ESU23205.1 hypothetical protein FEDK69T_13580 [Flavobacterium enshiense DK69]KGO96559.1 hypothetical protein Q767_06615 [Flavobacterium enshiense DK69]